MPVNGFSVGRDIALDIFDANTRATIAINTITDFDRKQRTQRVEVKALNGVVSFLELPQGWEGSIGLERSDRVLDDFIAALEGAYYSGGNVKTASITETITEPDGTVSQYRYEGCVFKLDDAGAWKGDSSVKQKLAWVASKRRKVI
ncbi:hypothetical protein GCM10007036_14450 [Alsobacter metallidurans]|uniref:Phage protein n=1 Tax=Alsobacter metallidurans TaxID=340221 RepID=A0A917MH33_9HYPH|nr:hypothetical protein [Alsobacter metallidurans]GGH14864.1 hypothetical protein GCM10007036_14450 [Alsobacter metallidurans]